MALFKMTKQRKKEIDDRYPILNETDYKKIADKKGLSENDKEIYVKFMQKRFAGERHTSYAEEWADRFKKGEPESHMDYESKEVYEMVKGKKEDISEKNKDLTIEPTFVARGSGNNQYGGKKDLHYKIKEWGYIFPTKEMAEKYAKEHKEVNGVIVEKK